MGASPTLLVLTSTARTSNVSSSIPICILRQMRRLEPPCLRAFHSPSPSALMPVLSIQLQETLDETSRLPQGHAEQDFHGQTGLDRCIAKLLLSTTLAGRRWPSCHPGIEPNRQRSTLLQRIIVSRPVRGLILCGVPTAHVPSYHAGFMQ